MTTYYNDLDPYCCKVLSKNRERGYLLEGYIDGRDIREVQANELMGYQHIHLFAGIGGFPLGMARAGYPLSLRTITGGFPCQPHSLAGKRQASKDERDLWGEMYRIICGTQPDYVLAENVPGLLSSENGRFFGRILRDLASCGYDAEWQVLSAEAFGAPHKRERVFLVAYPIRTSTRMEEYRDSRQIWQAPGSSQSTLLQQANRQARAERRRASRQDVADADLTGFQACRNSSRISQEETGWTPTIFERGGRSWIERSAGWAVEPNVDRVAHGIPHRVDRLRALGNAIVPQCAEYLARSIMAYEMEREAVA